MKGVGFEGLAFCLTGDAAQGTGANKVDRH
jgi:hypothetical protein